MHQNFQVYALTFMDSKLIYRKLLFVRKFSKTKLINGGESYGRRKLEGIYSNLS